MEIKKSTDVVGSTRTTSISIGNSRVGKTHFVGTMTEVGSLFVLDTEDGLKSIQHKQYDYVTVNTWAEAKEVINFMMTQTEYSHVAIDSLNRLQVYMIEAIKDNSQSVFPEESDGHKGKMTLQKWGLVTALTKKVVDAFTKSCQSSVHMNVTAMESKDEVTGMTMLYPALGGAFKHEVLGYFDTILYHRAAIEAGQQKYWIQLGADTRIQAGTRIQALKNEHGLVMPNDYVHIYNALTK